MNRSPFSFSTVLLVVLAVSLVLPLSACSRQPSREEQTLAYLDAMLPILDDIGAADGIYADKMELVLELNDALLIEQASTIIDLATDDYFSILFDCGDRVVAIDPPFHLMRGHSYFRSFLQQQRFSVYMFQLGVKAGDQGCLDEAEAAMHEAQEYFDKWQREVERGLEDL